MTQDNMLEQHNHIIEEQFDVVMRGKLKQPKREVDIPVLIRWIMKDNNLTYDELSEITGYSKSYLYKVAQEARAPEQITMALNLLMLFFKNTDRDIPLLGDHHE